MNTTVYRVRAVNTAPDSENKIHSDGVAAQYGFRGGLVPGVTVYGYLLAPIVESQPDWLVRGTAQARFLEPFYDGDEVVVRVEGSQISGERADGTVCATATMGFRDPAMPQPELLPEHPLPNQRQPPSSENIQPGALLGTVAEPLDLSNPNKFPTAALLQFSNEILVRNFLLGPWIHVTSEVINWSSAKHNDRISARARIHDRFDRKGHEFVVIDVMLAGYGGRLIQTVRHTAIYRPKARKQLS
jgi:hypothetical protein